eukprot:16064371-Heterocapsa_arctica.AAC.1
MTGRSTPAWEAENKDYFAAQAANFQQGKGYPMGKRKQKGKDYQQGWQPSASGSGSSYSNMW